MAEIVRHPAAWRGAPPRPRVQLDPRAADALTLKVVLVCYAVTGLGIFLGWWS